MPSGGQLTVGTCTLREHGRRTGVEISVSDTGTGIADEALEKLFVPFFTTKQSGTGLGLAICRRIVDAHGGELDVQSVRDEGATFVIRLPLAELATEERPLPE
jgi:signal transduction histidine kinase